VAGPSGGLSVLMQAVMRIMERPVSSKKYGIAQFSMSAKHTLEALDPRSIDAPPSRPSF
jgi:hypothetical protein